MTENGVQATLLPNRTRRLESVDLLRGCVMIIMALDHVRDFMSDRIFLDPTDLSTTTPPIFLTRWITHYCAPTFVFLAGTAAYLAGVRGRSKPSLSFFLFTRGLWLAFFEVTVNRMLWLFNFDVYHHGAGVFWAIGLSMVLLSLLVWLPTSVVTLLGTVMIATHNLLDGFTAEQMSLPGWVWLVLHSPGDAPVYGPITFGTGYCLIPWTGVMAVGYGFGKVLQLPDGIRQRTVFGLGAAISAGFLVLRGINVYGDASVWQRQSTPLLTALSFLNCTKYPPSLLYLLMTLGPSLMALATFDRPLGGIARPIITFGRVPLFFYVLHIALIHGAAVVVDYVRFGWSPLANHGPWEVQATTAPPGYGLGLPAVYLVWAAVVLALYPACRWYAGVKQRRHDFWLSYL
jgi:uncharacterized membrane protein